MDLFTVLKVKAELDGIATAFAKDLEPIIRAKEIKSSEVVLGSVTVHMGIDGRWHGSPVVKIIPYQDIIDLLALVWDTCDLEMFKKWYILKSYENSKILVIVIGNVGIPYETSAYAFPPLNQTLKPKTVEGEYTSSAISPQHKKEIITKDTQGSKEIYEGSYDSSAVAPQHRKETINKETKTSKDKEDKPLSGLEYFFGYCGLIIYICFPIALLRHFFGYNDEFTALLVIISLLSLGLIWLVDVLFNEGKLFKESEDKHKKKSIYVGNGSSGDSKSFFYINRQHIFILCFLLGIICFIIIHMLFSFIRLH